MDFLERLRGAGRHDSRGRFSLDPARALELMRRYQLPDPGHYILRLVSAAVASEARRFQVRRTWRGCVIEFDGRPPREEMLREPFEALLLGLADEAEAELAIALNAASSLGRVTLETAAGVLQLKPGGHRFQAGSNNSRWVRVRLERMSGREKELLLERAAYGPLAVRLDGKLLARPLDFRSACLVRRLVGPGSPCPGIQTDAAWRDERPGALAAWIGVGVREVSLLIRGVRYPMEHSSLFGAAAVADRLPLDLSRQQVVRGAECEQLLGRLEEEALRLVADALLQWDALGPDLQESLAGWIGRLPNRRLLGVPRQLGFLGRLIEFALSRNQHALGEELCKRLWAQLKRSTRLGCNGALTLLWTAEAVHGQGRRPSEDPAYRDLLKGLNAEIERGELGEIRELRETVLRMFPAHLFHRGLLGLVYGRGDPLELLRYRRVDVELLLSEPMSSALLLRLLEGPWPPAAASSFADLFLRVVGERCVEGGLSPEERLLLERLVEVFPGGRPVADLRRLVLASQKESAKRSGVGALRDHQVAGEEPPRL